MDLLLKVNLMLFKDPQVPYFLQTECTGAPFSKPLTTFRTLQFLARMSLQMTLQIYLICETHTIHTRIGLSVV